MTKALSHIQKRIYKASQLDEGWPTYNQPVAFHLKGKLDIGLIEKNLHILGKIPLQKKEFSTVRKAIAFLESKAREPIAVEARFGKVAAGQNSQNLTERRINTLIRFWEIWNRKEACFKALGLGLQNDMNQWDCSGNDWVLVNNVWVRSVPLEHPLSCAVAIRA